tara:strand:- start:2603 stop:4027 length:1425 start_codon:yes stop_codon:yes gene_type:complete
MGIPNQGYRRDLNLAETTSDRTALANLGGAGIAEDLDKLQNNLKNTSKKSFHTITDGYFDFADDINVGITSLRCIATKVYGTTGLVDGVNITAHVDRSYLLRIGDLIKIQNVTGTGKFTDGQGNLTGTDTSVGVDIFNGEFALTTINDDENEFTAVRTGFSTSIRDQNVSGSNLVIRGNDVFTYTNDDKVTFDRNVNIKVNDGSTDITDVNFVQGTEYYICDSDGLEKFKISTTPSYSESGTNPVEIKTGNSDSGYTGLTTTVSPNSFNFIRFEPVEQGNLINFIEPDIFDEGFSFGSGTFSDQLDGIQNNNESSKYFIGKKYKGTTNTVSSDFIKTEGTISMSDPKQKMNAANIVTSYDSGSGMFIEGTRAFSTDNNPWTDTGANKLETEADHVSIGELYFGNHSDGPVITGSGFDGTHAPDTLTGVKSVTAGTIAPTDFTYKIPVRIENTDGNVETYYLLLARNTENTSTLP